MNWVLDRFCPVFVRASAPEFKLSDRAEEGSAQLTQWVGSGDGSSGNFGEDPILQFMGSMIGFFSREKVNN